MARCMKSEKQGHFVFYGAMVCEGVIALIWAASMYLFKEKKNFWITAVPATFMSAVSCTYFVLAPECLGKMINTYADGKLVAYNTAVAYPIGIVFAIAMLALFIYATKKNTEKKAA